MAEKWVTVAPGGNRDETDFHGFSEEDPGRMNEE